MKKYWKSILICICLAVAVFIGVKGCKIEVPKDNTTVESSVENSSANEEKEYSTKVEEGNSNIKTEDKVGEEKIPSTSKVKDEDIRY